MTVSFGELSVVRRIYERAPGNERPFSRLRLSRELRRILFTLIVVIADPLVD